MTQNAWRGRENEVLGKITHQEKKKKKTSPINFFEAKKCLDVLLIRS